MANPKTYLWRDIDDELWRKAKTKAASEGVTLRDVLAKLLTAWVSKK